MMSLMRPTNRVLFAFGLVAASVAPAVAWASAWDGDYFPDVKLTAHTGEEVRFFSDLLEDRVVAINFMFTSCAAVCPTETARLRQVQRLLQHRVGKDVFMYSISIDPARDSVEALAEYAKKFDVGPGWKFLRASQEDVDLIQSKLGMLVENEDDPLDHSTSFIIGNQSTGRWTKRSPFEHPSILARLIGDDMHNFTVETHAPLQSYSVVQPRDQLDQGEYIYRTRCNACHTIGQGDELGPDLAGITKLRPAAWLERWIMEPDVMLEEGDELALAVKAKYGEVTMPNLGLTEVDAKAVIDYIAQMSGASET